LSEGWLTQGDAASRSGRALR